MMPTKEAVVGDAAQWRGTKEMVHAAVGGAEGVSQGSGTPAGGSV